MPNVADVPEHKRADFADRRAAWDNAQLADAAMDLLGCRIADDVYQVIGEFMALLVPDAAIIVSEITPDLEWFITRKVTGVDGSTLSKAVGLFGFELVGKRWAILPTFRDEQLSGTLSKIPDGFAELASSDIPRTLAAMATKVFGIRDVYVIGIADGRNALGNLTIVTRAPDVVLPTPIIESFAHHCFSALSGIRTARDLAESAERNRLLFDSMVEGLALHEIILDASGNPCDYRFLDVNPAFEAMTGLRAEDIVGRTALEVIPDLEPSWIERYGAVAMTGVSARFEDYASALARHYEVAAHSPQPGQFATMVSDITDRVAAQEALVESLDTFGIVFEHSVVAQSITLPTGEIQGNEAFYEMLGYKQQELGDTTTFMQLTHPDDIELSTRESAEMLSGDRASARFEKRYLRKDGSIVWVDVSTSLRRDAAGQPLYFMSTFLNITDRKNAEVELEKRGARLEELLDERERNLAQLAASLSSIIEVVGQVVETRDPYTAGHERRVSELATAISQEMGLPARRVEEIRVAALIHDVGKMSVPTEILSKPGKLSPVEFELIQGHAESGYVILASAHMDAAITEMVYQHHERCDGSGYPRGLSENDLLEGAKVLMVADVVEAMVSSRPYRPGLGVGPALAEIERGAGQQYDAEVAEVCVRLFRESHFEFSPSGAWSA